ncbi:energy transducer TonB [Aquimarina sp. 2201CG5-10]|uniref:energy transducer TonB n=1 Tax=Aquimarina callyspongiae TaxID=3098150 RepID=UPI002AB36DF2|nr:energy transducer TonB [Aquimarina sp. 2201CG5-10]MDY8135593.1 energy transducer TonB [Aquimarina sp. 2201CG5-10]
MNKLITLLLLCLLMISSNVYSQNIDIIQILKEDVCECTLQQVKNRNAVSKSILENCLHSKIDSYPEMFKITLDNEKFINQNKSDKNYSINLDRLNAFIAGHQKYFINHCESYYWYASRLRENLLSSYRPIAIEKTLKNLTKKVKRKKKENFQQYLLERAKIYMSTGLYDKAQSDLKLILNENSSHEEAFFHLAWTYELKHTYIVAKNLYIQLIKKNNSFDAILGLECVNRKINEKYESSLPQDLKDEKNQPQNSSIKSIDRLEIPPVPRVCNGLKDIKKIKNCFSSYMKQLINYKLQPIIEFYDNIKPGVQRIFVLFKVSNEGFITNIKIRGVDPYLANEITRIVSSVPPMKPGTQDGEPVEVLYSLPITFKVVNTGN